MKTFTQPHAKPGKKVSKETHPFSQKSVAPKSRVYSRGAGFTIIAAMDTNRGIGYQGKLPWKLRGDMDYFRDTTLGQVSTSRHNAVIMGRRTWDSLPLKFRPLPNRTNVVVSHQPLDLPAGVILAHSLDGALTAVDRPEIHDVFVIGGAAVFAEALKRADCARLLITEIQTSFPSDVSFPDIPPTFKEVGRSNTMTEDGVAYQFVTYRRV